ncbi:MAG: ABC transporter permease [Alphaproteobacteria bacterium]
MATDIISVDTSPGTASSTATRRPPVAHKLVAICAIVSRDIRSSFRRYPRLIVTVLIPIVLLVAVTGGFDGFRRALTEPYGTYVAFSSYLLPGLVGLILLLTGSHAAASLAAGRGAGGLKFFLGTPLPRWLVMFAKLLAVALLAVVQTSIFLLVASLTGVDVDFFVWLAAIPAVMIGVFMITVVIISLIAFLPSAGRRSALILCVVVPAFFLSTSLYPIWRFTDGGADYLALIVTGNPFTHVVELIRYASEGQLSVASLIVVLGLGILSFLLAVAGVNPKRNSARWWRSGWGVGQED